MLDDDVDDHEGELNTACGEFNSLVFYKCPNDVLGFRKAALSSSHKDGQITLFEANWPSHMKAIY